MRIKLYLASPWFSESQKTRMLKVLTLVDSLNLFQVYCPAVDGLVLNRDSDESSRSAAFKENLLMMDSCDVCLGITDEKDMGTIWEMGYCLAKGKLVIGYAETLGTGKFNLMLAKGCVSVAKNLTELKEVLTGKTIIFRGDVE